MTTTQFQLIPFKGAQSTWTSGVAISVNLNLLRSPDPDRPQLLKANFQIESGGPLDFTRDLCDVDSHPQRTGHRIHELWKSTCFEFFIAPLPSKLEKRNQTHYWEFNLNSNGDWNFYKLSDYRQNLTEYRPLTNQIDFSPTNFGDHPITIADWQSRLGQVSFEYDLKTLLLNQSELSPGWKMAWATVLRWNNGHTEYYAIDHFDEQPNFHHPKSFLLQFDNQSFHLA